VTAPNRRLPRALTAIACAGLLSSACLTTAGAARAAGRAKLSGTRPAWAVQARSVAAPDAAARVSARVYLAGRDPAGLGAYAAAVSQPSSRLYRKFLTSRQELQRFGPSAAQVAAVRGWLTAAGLRVTTVTRHYVTVTGSVPAAQAAFAVRLGRFRAPGGRIALAPEENLSVPDSVRPAVLGVTGLDTATAIMTPALAGGSPASPPRAGGLPAATPQAFYTARPCSAYYGQYRATGKPNAYGRHVPWAICGYTPQQLRSGYGLTAGSSTGSGVTVAVVDAYASPTIAADVTAYARAVGFTGLGAGQLQQVRTGVFDDQSECDQPSWYEEESLDVEAVHTMAPAADIEYVAAADCTFGPLLDALSTIVDNQSADFVTNSWTGPESGIDTATRNAFDQVFQQGAAEGIGVDFASGDCGYNDPSSGCGQSELSSQVRADYPATSAWVTAVGGTSLAIGQRGGYQWETGWGDMVVPQHGRSWRPAPPGRYPADYSYGAGGGTSVFYSQPSWQEGVVPAKVATRAPSGRAAARPMREVPDVAMDADPATGFRYGETFRLRGGKTGFMLSRIGGTSLSAPLFAGLEADAAEQAGTGQLGFADPTLYSLARTGAFHDVTDTPLGARTRVALARSEWARSGSGTGGLRTSLYTLGTDGTGKNALHAVQGYDDVTGLGSPAAAFIRLLAGTSTFP
jgi:subtilase family serine protease